MARPSPAVQLHRSRAPELPSCSSIPHTGQCGIVIGTLGRWMGGSLAMDGSLGNTTVRLKESAPDDCQGPPWPVEKGVGEDPPAACDERHYAGSVPGACIPYTTRAS